MRALGDLCVDEQQLTLASGPDPLHHRSMPVDRDSLQAVKNLISQAELALGTKPLSIPASRENLRAASAITDDLIKQAESKTSPAATLGHKGGSVTSQRYGPEHYRQMAAKRKTRAGGRPKKQT